MADSPAIEHVDGCYRVCGSVTLASVQSLLEQGRQVLSGTDLRVDLSGVSEADSSAVALLLAWTRDAFGRNATIRFEHLNENLKTLIALYDVGELIPSA